MTLSSVTQCPIFLAKTIQLAQSQREDRFKNSARRPRGINEVLTVGSHPALTPIGVFF